MIATACQAADWNLLLPHKRTHMHKKCRTRGNYMKWKHNFFTTAPCVHFNFTNILLYMHIKCSFLFAALWQIQTGPLASRPTVRPHVTAARFRAKFNKNAHDRANIVYSDQLPSVLWWYSLFVYIFTCVSVYISVYLYTTYILQDPVCSCSSYVSEENVRKQLKSCLK